MSAAPKEGEDEDFVIKDRFQLKLYPGNADFSYGCKQAEAIATVEDLLARLKDGRMIAQEMRTHQRATTQDYATTSFVLRASERLRVGRRVPPALNHGADT